MLVMLLTAEKSQTFTDRSALPSLCVKAVELFEWYGVQENELVFSEQLGCLPVAVV